MSGRVADGQLARRMAEHPLWSWRSGMAAVGVVKPHVQSRCYLRRVGSHWYGESGAAVADDAVMWASPRFDDEATIGATVGLIGTLASEPSTYACTMLVNSALKSCCMVGGRLFYAASVERALWLAFDFAAWFHEWKRGEE